VRLFTRGVLFDIGVLEKFVKANIPEVTFLEAYRTTRRVLNVTVTAASDKGVRARSGTRRGVSLLELGTSCVHP
jgi:hypothetical protein